MLVSQVLLALTLLIYGAIGLEWLPWPMHIVYVFSLATGIVMVLELLSVIKWRVGPRQP
jgi:hypothetical protein